jgi:hypothetical protein
MRKTRAVWCKDAVQIGDMLRNSETELVYRRAEIAKNFQIKICCFKTVLIDVLKTEIQLQINKI